MNSPDQTFTATTIGVVCAKLSTRRRSSARGPTPTMADTSQLPRRYRS